VPSDARPVPSRSVVRTTRQVLARMDGVARAGIAASACLRFTERCVLVVVAVAFVRAQPGRAVVVTIALAVLYGAHGALRTTLARWIYARLVAATVRALVENDVLTAIARKPEEDAQQAVFEGLYRGETLAANLIPDLVGNGAASLALIVLLAGIAPLRLVALGLVATLCAAVAAAFVRRLVTRAEERSHAAFVPVVDAIVAASRGRIEVVASGRGATFAARSDVLTNEWRRVSSSGDRIAAFAGRAPVAAAALVVGLVVVLDRASGSSLSIGALGDAAVFASVVPSFAGAARAVVEIARASTQLQPLVELLAEEPATSTRAQSRGLPSLPAAVALDDVSFVYPGDLAQKQVLRALSLRWSPQTALVIAGPNGAGKSTLLRLLLGLREPTAGTIAIGGISLFDLDLGAWRRSIAYLAQRPYLPERATVREAVATFALETPDDALVSALARVGVIGALQELAPTDPLGVRVEVLSVGQKQRIALARVLCQDAPIVLLDEPDANLDAAGIRLVAQLVREMARGKMVAVVAHTDELVGVADVVLRLGGERPQVAGGRSDEAI
jgi:ABC-type bacteriocin/lantibiotic exporter with double-glycine peptidase domain